MLGWQVTSALEPRYWVENEPKPGSHAPSDLTTVTASAIANHTAIIAQSGSGKSFFLGRLLEEIILKTEARCIILDPNADFRKIKDVEDASLWQNAAYDRRRGRGKLPEEATQSQFLKHWQRIKSRIRTGESVESSEQGLEKLMLPWSSVSVEFLAEELDATLRSDLAHCHAVIKNVESLLRLQTTLKKQKAVNLIETCESYFHQAGQDDKGENIRRLLKENFDLGDQINEVFKDKKGPISSKGAEILGIFGLEMIESWPASTIRKILNNRVSSLIDSVVTAIRYVPEQVNHYYFSKAREYESAGILLCSIQGSGVRETQNYEIEVLDIPSLKRATRLLAINTMLETEWSRARAAWNRSLKNPANRDDRTPTFIVVDEAHNLIPAETRGKAETALREQFRTIVAEGRKYGLFLILVSQRPDKLDPLVLSECENKAVMKLSSRSVLDITRRMLGLDDVQPKLLDKCLEFQTGRALLAGAWSPEPQFTYTAARRTVEGGRNLRPEHWAVAKRMK